MIFKACRRCARYIVNLSHKLVGFWSDFFYNYFMRKEKKIKTGFFSPARLELVPQRRHYSTLRNLNDPSGKLVTLLVEDLLNSVF